MADGRVILIDPWLQGNPATPENMKQVDRCDLMLLSHGHFDHTGDAADIALKTKPTVIAILELCSWLGTKGVENCSGMNVGGTQSWQDVQVTAVQAIHSSTATEGDQVIPTGLAVGWVIRFPDGFTVYHAGDTDVFEGMSLIGRLYRPNVALLPIGSHYTMGPREAAEAVRLLGVKHIIPIHYGTFPVLTGTPEQLEQELGDVSSVDIHAIKPGESLRQVELA
jgi:L-ascorbate metabolism protein UlaG (beta-lactamase superfamily)